MKVVKFVPRPKIDIIEEATVLVMEKLVENGYSVSNDDRVKDVALIVESIRAAYNRSKGLSHGLHVVSDRINVG